MSTDEIIEGIKAICAPLPESRALRDRIVSELEARLDDYVYVIIFDPDVFGIFATRKAAEESLARQIAEGGPAWEGCKVESWRVHGNA